MSYEMRVKLYDRLSAMLDSADTIEQCKAVWIKCIEADGYAFSRLARKAMEKESRIALVSVIRERI